MARLASVAFADRLPPSVALHDTGRGQGIDSPNGDPGGAPQPGGGALVDTLALRCMSACFFEGKVWTVFTQKGDNGNAVIHWVAVEPRTEDHGGSVIVEDGYIDGGPTACVSNIRFSVSAICRNRSK